MIRRAGLLVLFAFCALGGITEARAQAPTAAVASAPGAGGLVAVADLRKAPSVQINNREISATLFVPDPRRGFYRGTRFDWAGLIGSLRYQGHDFYAPWFRAMSRDVSDIAYQDGGAVVSANTAATGPVEEFNDEGGALGYAQARPGETFLKIGVGVLRRPDGADYSPFRLYPIVATGQRKTVLKPQQVEFRQTVFDARSGYGYRYTKTIRLLKDEPVLLIEHVLLNSGSRPITTTVYDHNFLNVDGDGTRAGLELTTPFAMSADSPLDPALARIDGQRFMFLEAPTTGQRVVTHLAGYGNGAADYDFMITDRSRGVSLHITADQPLTNIVLWAIQPVMAIEPYIRINVAPGQSIRWQYRYEFGRVDLSTAPQP